MQQIKASVTLNTIKPKTYYRWRIVALLLLATTINYIDRNVISFTMLDEGFRKEMLGLSPDHQLTETDLAEFRTLMGFVDAAFKWAYAIGFIFIGWMIDKIGTRKGFSISIFIWSVAGVAVAFVKSIFGLAFARFSLGIGEAGNYPASIKSVAEWFPKSERALANGIFNSGANFGIIITAVLVPWLTLSYGWRAAFIVTGSLGVILLILWVIFYKKPEDDPKLPPEEYLYIKSDMEDETVEKINWFQLLKYRQTWSFVTGKVLSDPIWWFYLTWLPDFFNSNEALDEKLDLRYVGIPFVVIYLVSDLGNIVFGWLSSYFIKIGWSANKARKITMLICAICVMPVMFASVTSSIYTAVALISLATAAHQGFSINNFTTISDMFPKKVVASIVGIGGFFGAVTGTIFAAFSGIAIVNFGYIPLFLFASTGYLIALIIIHILVPKLERAKMGKVNNEQ